MVDERLEATEDSDEIPVRLVAADHVRYERQLRLSSPGNFGVANGPRVEAMRPRS
jgi:hypothetical protein